VTTTARALYVHVPWCRRRCPYCDFYFVVGRANPAFVDGARKEIDARTRELTGPLTSIAFGGGTPSLLAPDDVRAVVDHARTVFGLVDDAEVTLEANPEDLDADLARALADAGVTRLSLGVQSFDDDVLRALGRAHDGARARAALLAAKRHVARVSCDLIIGVPGERAARLDDDLRAVLDAGVGHVSTYMLTVEDGTTLARQVAAGARADVDDDAQANAYAHARGRLAQSGFVHYEVSSFARADEESRHNRVYWGRGAYLGIGPGAHSLVIDDEGRAIRRANAGALDAWLAAPDDAPHTIETLDAPEALREAIAFSLRDLVLGIDGEALEARHRVRAPDDVKETLARFAREGFVSGAWPRARLTEEGALFADRVARDVLAP